MDNNKCFMVDWCQCRTAVCYATLPDDGCWVFRKFKPIIFDYYNERIKKITLINKEKTAQVSQGRIYYSDNGEKIIDPRIVCGNCFHKVSNLTEEYKYCPNCGAKLVWK